MDRSNDYSYLEIGVNLKKLPEIKPPLNLVHVPVTGSISGSWLTNIPNFFLVELEDSYIKTLLYS